MCPRQVFLQFRVDEEKSLNLIFREAVENDVAILVNMIADDILGSKREDNSKPTNSCYISAFGKIKNDPNNELIVVVLENEIVGMLQLTFIQYLGLMGSLRCIIGAVRVQSKYRGQGLGTKIIKWGIKRSAEKGCKVVQITSDKQRYDSIRFYEKLGFKATHEGLRLKLR